MLMVKYCVLGFVLLPSGSGSWGFRLRAYSTCILCNRRPFFTPPCSILAPRLVPEIPSLKTGAKKTLYWEHSFNHIHFLWQMASLRWCVICSKQQHQTREKSVHRQRYNRKSVQKYNALQYHCCLHRTKLPLLCIRRFMSICKSL